MPETFFFLYRTDAGIIGRGVWLRGTGLILAPIVVLTFVWLELEPLAAPVDGPINPLAIVAFTYLLVYPFAVILAAICFYNLTAKRFRARGWPGSLAGLFLLALLITGAADWLVPRSDGYVSPLIAWGLAALTLAIAVWTFIELGVLPDAAPLSS